MLFLVYSFHKNFIFNKFKMTKDYLLNKPVKTNIPTSAYYGWKNMVIGYIIQNYSRTQIIQTPVNRIANHPNRFKKNVYYVTKCRLTVLA